MEEGREINRETDRRLGVDVSGPDPLVGITTNELGRIRFTVLLFCPLPQVSELEREVSSRFLRAAYAGEFASDDQRGRDTPA